MNILKSKTTNRLAKVLTVVAVLILSFVALFFSLNSSSTAITVDCKNVSGNPQPGVNCLYSLKPLCTKNGINWTIPDETSSVLSNSQESDHRVNCFDLSDLPLCSQLTDNNTVGYPGKNCVNECNSIPSGTGTRGSDYAVHNRDCVRFCDAVENDVTAISGENCITRKCHQVSDAVQPNPPSNCALLKCNLLTSDELNDTKFRDTTTSKYQYCDKSVKCYEFSQNQLPFLIPNATCLPHNCRVSCIDNATDDVQKITDKGSSYVSAYQDYVNSGLQIGTESDIRCSTTICKPIVSVSYACLGSNDPADSPNSECSCLNCNCTETNGAACVCQNSANCTYHADEKKWLSNCSNGYCSQTIDCNDSSYANSVFCMTSDDEIVGTTNDSSIHSWFYRPKPHEMAVSGAGSLHSFQYDQNFSYDSVCYSINQMDDNGWGDNRCQRIVFGIKSLCVYLGYFHEVRLDPRSPKKCHAANLGIRGTGYDYLCGVKLDFAHNAPRDDAAYQYGYVESTFSNNDATHVETVCLRFDATGAIGKSCGKRECQITCAFAEEKDNSGCTQICGRDVCVDLKIKDSDPNQCMMNGNLFTQRAGSNISGVSATSRECMKIIDKYIRVRAVKYGDYICNFIDFMGDTAYSGRYHDGSEKINITDKLGNSLTYCESGSYDKDTERCPGGKNTNEDKTRADRWRTIKRVPYIDDNRPVSSSNKGYLDVYGRLFPQQTCIKVAQRITVPRLYNLASSKNSPKIFVPPLYIQSATIKRGGTISNPQEGEDLGETDFHYPEINVSFGTSSQKLSLGFGKTGYEGSSEQDSLGSATIETTLDGGDGTDTYSLEIFVRKEYNEEANRPTFCLYKKVKDSDGVYLDPERVECVYRKYPEINNKNTKLPSEDLRKLIITADASSTYSDGKIVFQYLSGSETDENCSSTGSSCSTALSLSNPDTSKENCDLTAENHKICVKRDSCNKLNNECIQNEINLHNAQINNQETSSFLAIQNQCNQTLLPSCNAKLGINTPSNATITSTNPGASAIDPKAYGWFNEICITSGFETKLRRVYAYLTETKTTGKCLVEDPVKCPNGGKKPDCPCREYVEGITIDGLYDRDETPHEAGLCVDLPLPQLCPAINHNPSPSSNNLDINYVASSLGYSVYGSSLSESNRVVNLSHKIRDIGLNGPFNGSMLSGGTPNTYNISGIPVSGHADFPQQIFGFDRIIGTCSGFWKNAVVNGVSVPPISNCLNSGGVAIWDSVTNPCVRYSCPAISTSGIDQNGNYQGNYTNPGDPSDQKGLSNGFATWPSLTKTNDFLEYASATSCVTGYKKSGATASWSTGEATADRAAIYNHITGYNGGILASRACDQRGNWSTLITNSCQRISCNAINLAADGTTITNVPTTSTDEKWELWKNSGGASFPAAKAALSSTLIDGSAVKNASTSSGTCNNSLGFFQISSLPPTRVCNHLGNWEAVKNPCVTKCDAVTCNLYPGNCMANDSNHGYATWSAVTNVPISGEADGSFGSCIGPGSVISQYPALRDKYGNAYTLADCSSATCPSGSIPRDVTLDTRAPETPKRVCRSVTVVGGSANVWTTPSSSCVTSCAGFNEDPRINVGITKHPASSNVSGSAGEYLTVQWPSTNFGSWAYYNSSSIDSQNASHYFYGRTNGSYSLARYCNPDTHKWEEPIPTCVTNDGIVAVSPTSSSSSYAKYSSPTRVAVSGSVLPGTIDGPKIQTNNGTCSASGSYYHNSNGTYTYTTPPISCSYKDANKRIDETYFNTNGAAICSPMCSSYRNKTYGTGSVDLYGTGSVDLTSEANTTASAPAYYAPGTTLSLSCINNYGSAIIGGSRTDAFNDCGRSTQSMASDRSSLGPKVTCNDNSNGTASWSSVANNCEECRNCDSNSLNYTLHQKAWCYKDCGGSNNTQDQCFVVQDNNRNGCGNSNGDWVTRIDVNACSHNNSCQSGPTRGHNCGSGTLYYKCVDDAYYYPTNFIDC